jgi:uncharacterized protein (TIGR02145 family)
MKTKERIRLISVLIIGMILVSVSSCKKEKTLLPPELSTTPLSNITSTSFVSGGIIISDGGSVILARGICWGKDHDPTISGNVTIDGSGSGSFFSTVNGLTSGTDYFIRAYATNVAGTSYGNEFIFILPLTDNDGNIYNTIIIGSQVWMTVNLKTTKFNDDTPIPFVTDNLTWGALTSPAYCWYKNDGKNNKENYGALYNWFTVNTGKLCPSGWHVPGDAEWRILTDYLGGESVASGKLKETNLAHWMAPNTGASNEYGFTARPGGYRTGLSDGSFHTMGYYGWWWAGTQDNWSSGRARLMTFDAGEIESGAGLKKNGYSVRCIKDQ